jgi:hypothetical protein
MQHFTPYFWRKCLVSLCVFARDTKFHFFSEYAFHCQKHTVFLCGAVAKTRSSTPLFCRKRLIYQKSAVTKTTLSCIAYFWRQRAVMLRAFGENRKRKKILNIRANLKKIFKNGGFSVIGIY